MADLNEKDYIAVVQCDIVTQRCSGYGCEKSFHERAGGFSAYPKQKNFRMLEMTCGGCCGMAVHRKLNNLVKRLKKDGVGKDRVVVKLASCVTKDNYHSPPCPHIDYMKTLIGKIGLDICEDTCINEHSEQRRADGTYSAGN